MSPPNLFETLRVGDWIKVTCKDSSSFEPGRTKVFIGEILSIFDAIAPEGNDWHLELRGPRGEWFLYKSKLDGGTFDRIERKTK